jgi:hypothetical protein
MASQDIRDAKGTYASFIGMAKVGSVVVALVVALVIVLIS